MDFSLICISPDENAKSALAQNALAARYGLALTREEALDLAQTHAETLRGQGRVEFGEPLLGRLIGTFCDSPYLFSAGYVETLCDLAAVFYSKKQLNS